MKTFLIAVLSALVVFTSFIRSTSSSSTVRDTVIQIQKCSSDDQCNEVCFNGGDLESRCDSAGVCICDCHNETIITSSYTSACEGTQPDGEIKTNCSKYITTDYQRPSRFCTDSHGSAYCTAVCNYNG